MFDTSFEALVAPKHLLDEASLIQWFPRRPTVRILIVADTSVGFGAGFGIGRAIDLIRANADGYVRLEVDLARLGQQGATVQVNGSPGADPKYTHFRFSSEVDGDLVLDGYDQVWCFGFQSSGSAYDTTNADKVALTKWMNAGGGVLAMGDHDELGAAMCAGLPRVGTMRRWTAAQGVPKASGPTRHVTNRPQDASQTPGGGAATIPTGAQSDAIPQPIEYKRYPLVSPVVLQRRYRPHPVLCGGRLGVIDVLPDHQHEGWVYEDDDIDTGATYRFAGYSGAEYPTVGGVQPTPEVIAWANTLGDPPYDHAGSEVGSKRFGVIGAYDGARVDVGRVLVDSTWHHWMDLNLDALEAETPNGEFDKVARYFRNCAVWLSRPAQRRAMLRYTTFWTLLQPAFFEEFSERLTVFELGDKALDVLERETSACMVRDWTDLLIPELVRERLERPLPDPCWSCPPFDLPRAAVLGAVVERLMPLRDDLQTLAERPKDGPLASDAAVARAFESGQRAGLAAFSKALHHNADALAGLARDLDESACAAAVETKQ